MLLTILTSTHNQICRAQKMCAIVSNVPGTNGRIFSGTYALLAQLVERRSCKPKATGSNPVGSSIIIEAPHYMG